MSHFTPLEPLLSRTIAFGMLWPFKYLQRIQYGARRSRTASAILVWRRGIWETLLPADGKPPSKGETPRVLISRVADEAARYKQLAASRGSTLLARIRGGG